MSSNQPVLWASQALLVVKNPPANAGDLRDVGLIPGSGRSPGKGNGNPLPYSCLENSMASGAWRATNTHRHTHTSVTAGLFSSVQSLSHVQLFVTPWTAACLASLSITNSQSLLKLMSIESVMPSNYLIHVIPFSSHLQSFPASGSFPMSQCFTSDGQSIGVPASASVFPMNIQD